MVDLNGTSGDMGLLQGEVAKARPIPLGRIFHQPFSNRIEVHIGKSVTEFLVMANEAIPELMLPERSGTVSVVVDSACGNPFDVLHDTRDGERIMDADRRMPMIRHEDVAAKAKIKFTSRLLKGADRQRVFVPGKLRTILAEIHSDEEDPITEEKAFYARHGSSVTARKLRGK